MGSYKPVQRTFVFYFIASIFAFHKRMIFFFCRFIFWTFFPKWTPVSLLAKPSDTANAVTDCSLSLVVTDGQTKKCGYEAPDELECQLLHSFAKFCYVPEVHCISLLTCLSQWRRSKTRCPRTKINKPLFICEQLLFSSVINHFKTFWTSPMNFKFRIDRAITLTVQGLRVEGKDHKTDA